MELDWNPVPDGGAAFWIDLILFLRGVCFLGGVGVGGVLLFVLAVT